jgi:mitochondrial fission protein ELM1
MGQRSKPRKTQLHRIYTLEELPPYTVVRVRQPDRDEAIDGIVHHQAHDEIYVMPYNMNIEPFYAPPESVTRTSGVSEEWQREHAVDLSRFPAAVVIGVNGTMH